MRHRKAFAVLIVVGALIVTYNLTQAAPVNMAADVSNMQNVQDSEIPVEVAASTTHATSTTDTSDTAEGDFYSEADADVDTDTSDDEEVSAAIDEEEIVSHEPGVALVPEQKETDQEDEKLQSVKGVSLQVPEIPFYSQFNDVSAVEWRKSACGVASVGMLIEYYKPGTVTVDTLLQQGIDSGAYLDSAGWIHSGLADLATLHGLYGQSYDYAHRSMDVAYAELEEALAVGPVIASVYYTFTPGHPIPHLVVVNGVKDRVVYYNDPAEESGGGTISVKDFKAAWKKRYIEVRPGA